MDIMTPKWKSMSRGPASPRISISNLAVPCAMQDGEGHVFTGIAIAITDEVVKLNLNHPVGRQRPGLQDPDR